MARPLRPAPAPPASTPLPASAISSSTPRQSSRPHRPSAALIAATTASTPPAAGPSTPSDSGRQRSESKAHGLRSVGGAAERTPCPFPAAYGGRDKCGISAEDEGDEVLMSILSSIAYLDNRALSAEEIAITCFQQGWLRPPSAAIEPTTLINNSIRSYIKRCEKNRRHCLLSKYQLAGSVVESVLQSALHPSAFDDSMRPKGTVWYLCGGTGKTKWKSPFDGIEIPKLPPRKPAPPKKQVSKDSKPAKVDLKKTAAATTQQKGKSKASASAPVKIRLVVAGAEDESASEVGSSRRSRSPSMGESIHVTPQSPIGLGLLHPAPLVGSAKPQKRSKPRRPRDILDSSSDSDTSDSDLDIARDIPGPSRLPRNPRSYRPKMGQPLGGSPRVSSSRLPQHSPFMDVFFPSPIIPSSMPAPHASPFPSHSLDNTTWTARHDRSHFFETSSSSSDDEMRDPTWGLDSEILIRAPDGEDERPSWSMEEDEAKVKEATDALRVLFPMSSPDEELDLESKLELNQLDNHPSILQESPRSSLVERPYGRLKAVDAGGIPLNAWIANSSPAASPNLRTYKNLAPPDLSPTQHLSKLRSSFDPEEMEVDDESPWLDETGELPVKAEDSFSDADLGSTVGDAPTPEHDRHLHTALWAQEAAAIRIKQEPEDYPSPVTTEDDHSAVDFGCSRGSSTPSSGSSELPPFEIDIDNGRMGVDEVILGPESISVEELESWLPAQGKVDRTPHRGRAAKSRAHPSRCSGTWGGIGVGSTFIPNKPPARTRSTRSNATARRSRSSPSRPAVDVPEQSTPESEIEDEFDDAIGTADLERARVEAEAKEEQHRKACKAKAEHQRALLEAYRQTVRGETSDSTEALQTPWSEGGAHTPWGVASTESLSIVTPGALSPMALHCAHASNEGMRHHMTAVDPKALVSPPIQPGFAYSPGHLGASPGPSHDLGMGMLDGMLSQQEIDAFMSATPPGPVSMHAPASATPNPIPSSFAPSVATVAPPAPSRQSIPALPPAIAPVKPAVQTSRPATPSLAPAPPLQAMQQHKPIVKRPVTPIAGPPSTPLPPQSAPIPAIAVTADAKPMDTAVPAQPIVPSNKIAPQLATATPPNELAIPSATPSPLSSMSSTTTTQEGVSIVRPSTKTSGKIPAVTKRVCPGVDACVIDNIPVYAHLFEGKQGQGKQVLLRRLDSDFVNANALLHALGVPENKHADFFNNPISPSRMAARQVVPATIGGVEYFEGVSGTWVHLFEAKEFARRAKLPANSLLANILREDLFRLFAIIANLNPEHLPADAFGSLFAPGPPRSSSAAPTASSTSSPTLSAGSANSKSTPNLTALSTSAPGGPHGHVRNGVQLSGGAPVPTAVKAPLIRSAPPTPPDGCPQPKRRRATISSPLAKKPGVHSLTPMSGPQAIAPAPASATSVPAAGTRLSIAAQKRATRASIGGGVALRPNVASK
ncbi:hypothetical protein IAU60_000671 [Kwoniella sp. DSM 27419]